MLRDMIAQAARRAAADRAEWLEDVLAGLLTNGVAAEEIEVQQYPANRTVVVVRGVPRYEWKMQQRKFFYFPRRQ